LPVFLHFRNGTFEVFCSSEMLELRRWLSGNPCFERAQWSHFQGSTVQWNPDACRRPCHVWDSHPYAPRREYLVRTRADPVWFVMDKATLTYVFLRVFHSPTVSIIPPMLHTRIYLRVSVIRRTNGRSLGTWKQTNAVSKNWDQWAEEYNHTFLQARGLHLLFLLCFCNWSPVGRKRCDFCIEVRSGRPFMTSHSRSR
jgi:hypothetical protein